PDHSAHLPLSLHDALPICLDAVVYQLGLARTRRQARQLVNHGHVTVDGGRVDIPSYMLKPGQVIGLREKSHNLDIVKEAIEYNKDRKSTRLNSSHVSISYA